MTKKLIPDDLRDFLSIISFVGFIGIFLEFSLGKTFISDNLTSVFLILAGAGLMVIGKVFHITRWMKDGVQKSEITQLISIIFGLSGMIVGFMLLFKQAIPISLTGLVGILALVPAIFIFFDYLAKNK